MQRKSPPVVPDECLEADCATLAQKGAGKTYLNRGLVERLLDMRRRVIVMDPLGHWWGLKAKADGSPGYPVAVIGGKHADVPLDPTRGEELGAFLASSSVPAVIDVSGLKRGEMTRFATAFFAELYRLNEDALWLILEEADVFAPQQPMNDQTLLLHEVDQIARRGRARGFRLWTITQRPAKLHKDVLTQISTLLLLRLRAPQDRAAAEEWIKGHAEKAKAAEIIASLASLAVGEGYVWAPDQDLLQRVHFPKIRTLDTSSTPKAGEARPTAGKLAKPDLAGLLAAVGPKPEPEKAPAVSIEPAEREAIRKAGHSEGYSDGYGQGHLDGWIKGQEAGAAEGRQQGMSEALRLLRPTIETLEGHAYLKPIEEPEGSPVALGPKPEKVVQLRTPQPFKPEFPPTIKAPEPVAPFGGARPSDLLNPRRQAILDALAWAESLLRQASVSRIIVAFLADASPKASGFQNNLGALRTAGLIDYPESGMVALTLDGRAMANAPAKPPTPADLQDQIGAKLPGPQRAIFRHVLAHHPRPLSREEVAQGVEKSPKASGFQNDLGRLRTLGLLRYPSSGTVAAEDYLFGAA